MTPPPAEPGAAGELGAGGAATGTVEAERRPSAFPPVNRAGSPASSVRSRTPGATWQPRQRGPARWAPALSTLVVIAGVIGVTLWQLHLPLLLSNTTTTGGDTGAHYMMPAYFTSNLFPHLTGWDPAWYDGYPIYTFYFVLPDVLVALASHVLAYNIAFKLATVMGSVLLPVAAWACGRLFGLRSPVPAALAAATLPFLFDYTWTIYGGNLFSTLAGEYSYSLSIVFALVFIGLMAKGVRTGRHRTWTAIVLALAILAHIVPAMLALAGGGLLTLFELLPDRLRPLDNVTGRAAPRPPRQMSRPQVAWWAGSTAALGVLLSGWWLVPFRLDLAYSTSMNYKNVDMFVTIFFPHADLWALVLAGVAVVVALWLRSRFGLLFALLGGISAAAVMLDPQGSLYNVRFLPLWFLCIYLMVGWLFGTGAAAAARWWRRDRLTRWTEQVRWATGHHGSNDVVRAPAGSGAASGAPASRLTSAIGTEPGAAPTDVPAGMAPGSPGEADPITTPAPPPAPGPPSGRRPTVLPPRPRVPRWLPGSVVGPLVALAAAVAIVVPPFVPAVASSLPGIGVHPGANEVSAWAQWNYTGYEGKAAYPEYRALMQLMIHVGHRYGCGRAMWEYNKNENRFGTPEALMLLPYWSSGCIDSMEGLLFESSATTPYHFLNQAELSAQPSDAVVGLPYGSLDVPLGIQHLQLLGVRYFMAFSPQVQQAAALDPSLRQVGSTGPWSSDSTGQVLSTTWKVYLVKGSSPVVPLTHEPAVLQGVSPDQTSWLGSIGPQTQPIDGPSVAWYLDPARWDVELTAGGLPSWPRVSAQGAANAPAIPVPHTTVSHIRQTSSTISFHVSRIGTPVLVKTSYFPNWQASGADGPWRATPNLMVVVPTRHQVTLTYGTSTADVLGYACTAAGVAGLVVLGLLGLLRRRRRARIG